MLEIEFTMGNLGFDVHRDTLLDRVKAVLQQAAVEPMPVDIQAPYLYGSIAYMTFTSAEQGLAAKTAVQRLAVPHQPCTKPVWLDRRKTGADLLPNRILRRALREVQRLEAASLGKEVEACFRSKKIYVGTGPDARCVLV